jgi:serine/threonine-protein kinase
MTEMGIILGTAAYMSPEQAKGKPVDRRADIWAFGCVLYEMLTGTRAFRGQTVSETLAEVMKSEPSWTALPPETPATLRNVVRRCLEKDPRKRVRDIGDVCLALDGAFETAAAVDATAGTVPRPRVWQRPAPLVAGIVALLGVTVLVFWALTRPAPPRVTRLTVIPSGTAAGLGTVAISPDGARLAYVGGAAQEIFVRALDQLQPTGLQANAVRFLFFSPDGQWIGFSDGSSAIKKVAVAGGPPVVVGRTAGGLPYGASWSTDDTIVFGSNGPASGLLRLVASGGEPEVLTTPNRERGELSHLWPEVLPDGRAVLFTITTPGGLDQAQIAVLDLATREQKILIRGGSHARYVPTGHLVFGVAGTLRAVAFDLGRLQVVGTPVPVMDQVVTSHNGGVNLSMAGDGTLIYVPGGVQPYHSTLVWVDRQGREEPLKAPPRLYLYPRLSPDGTRVALDVRDQERDIWIWDLARETLTRFTFDPRPDTHPLWTPDGQRVLFRSARSGPFNLFWQAADGTGTVERLTESQNNPTANAFSPDGTRLVFREETAKTGEDLMVVALEGGNSGQLHSSRVGEPEKGLRSQIRPLVQTTSDELNAEISPDGRWMAYQSNESGKDEIYVRPFPDTDRGRWQMSAGGGTRPLWARSGKELFYVGPSGAVMSASVEGGSTLRAGNPTRLFEGHYLMAAGIGGRTYDVSPDGRRFLMIKPVDGGEFLPTAAPTSLIIVQNWTEELKRLVPTK